MAHDSCRPRSPAALAAELLRVVDGLCAEMCPGYGTQARLGSSLERDLGLDSLARAELLLRTERAFGVRFPEDTLARIETPLELLRAVAAARESPQAAGEAVPPLTLAEEEAMAAGAPADLPTAATTLVEVLEWHASTHPERVHILFYATAERIETLTYGALLGEARAVAAGLAKPGQAVAIMLPTCLEFFHAFYGILLAGGVPVPLYLSGEPVEITGAEQLTATGRFVLVANHASYIDGIIVAALVGRPCTFFAKRELGEQFFAGAFLRGIGAELVERFDVRRSVEDARRSAALARGDCPLLFFPEGTFTRESGLRPFRLGAFVAAAEAGVPLVPVAIRGTREILRDESWFPHRGPLKITVGAPLMPAGAGWHHALALRNSARAYIPAYCDEPDLARQVATGLSESTVV